MLNLTKKCYKCNKNKDLISFSKDRGRKDGLQLICKECVREYRNANKQNISKQKATYAKIHSEEIAEYMADYHKIYYGKNKEEILIERAIYKKKHRKETAAQKLKWRLANPGLYASYCAKRRVAKLQATPKDLTKAQKNEIKAFYTKAARLTKETGILHHVDHVVPLQGENVSGLHVSHNLQILTDSENSSKGNKFDGTYENNSWRSS